MRSESVASALERTEQIFFTDRATGLATDRDQSERIRMHFTHAWDSYSGATGAQATPRGFAAYLAESADHAEANGYVHELRALMCDVRIMGVTPLEYQITRDAVLGPLTPSSMQPEEFYHVIEGTEFELQE